MKYLVTVEAEWNAANKLDSGPGGPGPLFGYIAERFRPEAFYVMADRRGCVWVLDLADGAAMTEFTHVVIARAGTYPKFVPLMTAQEAGGAIPKAIAEAKKAP